jgi:hypothetical protein
LRSDLGRAFSCVKEGCHQPMRLNAFQVATGGE